MSSFLYEPWYDKPLANHCQWMGLNIYVSLWPCRVGLEVRVSASRAVGHGLAAQPGLTIINLTISQGFCHVIFYNIED